MICVGLAKSSLFGLAPSYAPSGLFPSNLLRPALCGSLYCRTTELSDSARALHKKIINIMVTALMAILPKASWLNSSQQHRALKIWNDYTTYMACNCVGRLYVNYHSKTSCNCNCLISLHRLTDWWTYMYIQQWAVLFLGKRSLPAALFHRVWSLCGWWLLIKLCSI